MLAHHAGIQSEAAGGTVSESRSGVVGNPGAPVAASILASPFSSRSCIGISVLMAVVEAERFLDEIGSASEAHGAQWRHRHGLT